MAPLSSPSPPNYSFYALGIYYVLILVPQFYGVTCLRSANQGRYDNANPRGTLHQQAFRKSVDKKTVALYERANAAHVNGFENFTLFASAVICATIARVDVGTLNTIAGLVIVLRVAYIAIYLSVEKGPLSFLRTGIWAAGTACSLYLLLASGRKMADGGPLST